MLTASLAVARYSVATRNAMVTTFGPVARNAWSARNDPTRARAAKWLSASASTAASRASDDRWNVAMAVRLHRRTGLRTFAL